MLEAEQEAGLAASDGTTQVRAIYRKMQWSLRAGDLQLKIS
jgi:hypothetical protein